MAGEIPTYVLLLLWSVVFLFASFRIFHVDLGFDWPEWKAQIEMLWRQNRGISIVRLWMCIVVLHVPFLLILLYINYTKFFP